MVLISRQTKRKVYEHLLTEGVIVIKKVKFQFNLFDWMLPEHQETGVPNLQVWMLLRSLKSKNFVEDVFNWYQQQQYNVNVFKRQYFYFWLNVEGVKYLRNQLGIVEEHVVPITFKPTKKTFEIDQEGEERPERRERRGGRRGFGRGGGRSRQQESE